MCNTAMEREYCELSKSDFKIFEKNSYEEHCAFFWQLAEMANAKSNKISNFEVV